MRKIAVIIFFIFCYAKFSAQTKISKITEENKPLLTF